MSFFTKKPAIKSKSKQIAFGLLLISLLILCDQMSKMLILLHMSYKQEIVLLPYFSLLYTTNKGIAFSLFSQFDSHIMLFLTVIITGFFAILWLTTLGDKRLPFFAFCAIIAGALGNIIDRLRYGYVIDFIYFHSPAFAFAIFNLADSFITIGAALFMINEILDFKGKNKLHNRP